MEYFDFIYAGFHIKRAPVWFREGLAKLSETAAFSMFLKSFAKKRSCEIVPILTCNRFEMLFVGLLQEADIFMFYEELLSRFEEDNKLKLKKFNYSESLRVLKDDDALRTLIGVASSLDSLIVGESQIFGQVKKSYFQALEEKLCFEKTTFLMHYCFRVVKRVRTETDIGKHSVSLGQAAIGLVKQVFSSLEKKKFLILGAGNMARVTLSHLKSMGIKNVTVASRTLSHAKKLAQEYDVSSDSLDNALSKLCFYDVCMAAIAGPNILLYQKNVRELKKTLVCVDLSVPHKIHKKLSEIDNVFLFDMEDMRHISETNLNERKDSVLKAKRIIEDEVKTFLKLLEFRNNDSLGGKFHHWVSSVLNKEVEKYLSKKDNSKKDLSPEVIVRASAKKMTARFVETVRDCKDKDFFETSDELNKFFLALTRSEVPKKGKANS
jgi:glutamyl-tRNA reductase